MVVLLVGGGSVLMNAMIDKLNKNGHRVYLLTGRKEKYFSYKRVFEKYDFPYDSDSVKDILESVQPDATIFMGAYDTNFTWKSPRQDAVKYMTGMMNILSACSMIKKKGRFLYFSSQEVYGNIYMDDIREDEPVSPKGFRAMALAQGEEACTNYRKMQGMDTVVLRFDHMYWVPEKGKQEDNPCALMCLEALKTGKISANGRRFFSMIYLNDAVEEIYKLAVEEEINHPCYHISSMEVIGEMELAKKIQAEFGPGIEILDNTVGEGGRLVLDGNRYIEEFGQKIFNHYDDCVKRIVSFMKRNSTSFVMEEDSEGDSAAKVWDNILRIFRILRPFIENLICFIPFFMLNNRTVGSAFFAKLDFYLLYVLLFAVIYGQQQAVFSGLLAIAGYCFRQMYERTGFDVLLDYNTYVWTAQLFIVGLAVGYLRDQLKFIKREDESRIEYLKGQLRDIEEINDSNVRMKQNFETQVINHRESLGKIYEVTSTLEQYGPEEVLFYAAQVLSKLMDCGSVAVYTVANRDYARLFSATAPDARKLGNSIKYTGMEDMYSELKEGRVYINKKMEKNMPMMARAVYSEDEMQLILMLWGIPWERMTLGEANRLTIIGHLIQNAVVRANHYLEALRSNRYLEGTRVLDEKAFVQLEKAFFDARDKGLTEYLLLEVLVQGQDYESVSGILGNAIRQTDYLGLLNGRLYVLLPNTNIENIDGIMERFRNAGYESRVEEAMVK